MSNRGLPRFSHFSSAQFGQHSIFASTNMNMCGRWICLVCCMFQSALSVPPVCALYHPERMLCCKTKLCVALCTALCGGFVTTCVKYSSIITLVSNLPYGTVARLGQTEWKIFIQDVMLSWVEGESLKMITVLRRGTRPIDYSIAWRGVCSDPQSHCVIYGPPSTIPVAGVSNSNVEEADLMLTPPLIFWVPWW